MIFAVYTVNKSIMSLITRKYHHYVYVYVVHPCLLDYFGNISLFCCQRGLMSSVAC